MIPKIIHYIWFGKNPLPPEIEKCILSWRKFMSDWEIMKWDEDSVKNLKEIWLEESLKMQKYAFASDYVRMWALYNYGGIYLDTDVVVFKSFNPLLNNPAFIGRESCLHIKGYLRTCVDLTSYCFGAEKGNLFIKKCLDYYKDRKFILSQDMGIPIEFRLSILNLSYIMCEIAKTLGYKDTLLSPEVQKLPELTVYPSEYFNSPKMSKLTFCKHLSVGSWRKEIPTPVKYTLKYKISWRFRKLIEIILKRFNFIIIKMT